MRFPSPPYILILSVIIAFAALTAQAQGVADRTTLAASNEELLNRLEKAEARIRVLEANLSPPAALVPTLLPAPDDTLRQATFCTVSDAQTNTQLSAINETSDGSSPPGRPLQEVSDSHWSRVVKVGGRIHTDGTLFPTSSQGIGFFENPSTGDDPENRLEFRRLRLQFSGDLLDDMFYKLDFDFSTPDSPEVLDAYLAFRDVPCLQTIVIGNQKRPLGISVFTSSNNSVFMEDALVFGESTVDARRVGVLSRGYSADESVNWQFGVFDTENLQSTGLDLSDSLEVSAHTRVTATPWFEAGGQNYFHVGANTLIANANDDAQLQSRPELRTQSRWIDTGEIADSDWRNATGVEAVLNLGRFSAGAEWVGTTVHRADSTSLFFHGGYLYVGYFLTEDYQPLDRQLGVLADVQPRRNFSPARACCGGWGAWQVAARISYFDLTDEDILGGRETNFTLGLNWWFNPAARLMFNYVVGTIDDHAPVGGFTGGHFSGLAMRMQVSF